MHDIFSRPHMRHPFNRATPDAIHCHFFPLFHSARAFSQAVTDRERAGDLKRDQRRADRRDSMEIEESSGSEVRRMSFFMQDSANMRDNGTGASPVCMGSTTLWLERQGRREGRGPPFPALFLGARARRNYPFPRPLLVSFLHSPSYERPIVGSMIDILFGGLCAVFRFRNGIRNMSFTLVFLRTNLSWLWERKRLRGFIKKN